MTKLADVIAPGGMFVSENGTRVHVHSPVDMVKALRLAQAQGGTWTSASGVETKIEKG